jgi:hypothetical protein
MKIEEVAAKQEGRRTMTDDSKLTEIGLVAILDQLVMARIADRDRSHQGLSIWPSAFRTMMTVIAL